MSDSPLPENFFVAGGTLKATTPSYVKRPADDELFEAVMDGQLCYVLTPRQMGKSSLMTRASRRLEENGIRTASIDLTSIGTQVTAQQWYTSILSQISRRLNLGVDAQEWCKQREGLAHVQVFIAFLEEIVLERIAGRVVIFIDEIDSTLSLGFRDDFFAGLRAIYNARTDKPAFERISFVLLGVASPSDLIADRARTPFNIGRAIALQEFDLAGARVLQDGLDAAYPGQGEQILARIFHWTNGHPYLTQKLCSEIVERRREAWTDDEIDGLVHDLFLSEQARKETNLKFVQDRLLDTPRRAALLGLYQRILRGNAREDGQSALQNELKLSGLVRAENGLLRVRNPIYAIVFNLGWVQVNTPKNWAKNIAIILAIFSFILLSIFVYDFIIGSLSKQYAGDIITAQSSNGRLEGLAKIFELKGIITSDYGFIARESFYNLKPEYQRDLFADSYISTEEKQKYLIPVVKGLYVTMANVPGNPQDSTELLTAMSNALRTVKSDEGQMLQEEIDLWIDARRAGKSQQAINKYDQAIELGTGNPSIRFERARIEFQMGQYELALSDLNTVISLAQNISTKNHDEERATLTNQPLSTSTILHFNQTPTSLRNTPPPSDGLNGGETNISPPIVEYLQDSYRSNFSSLPSIYSAVSHLLDHAFFRSILASYQIDKYPVLASSGLLPSPILSSSVLYHDDFSDSSSGWPSITDADGITDYDEGAYRIRVDTIGEAKNGMDIWAHPGIDLRNDTRIEVDSTKIGGPNENDFGVLCRYKREADSYNFYYFIITNDGYLGISKMKNSASKLISGETLSKSNAINKTITNHIRADCIGSTLALYINGEQVATAIDNEFKSGDIGLIAGTFGTPGTDILFDNFIVITP